MKIMLIIMIAGLLLVIGLTFFDVNSYKNSDVDLSVSIDKTDSFKANANINEILSFLHISDRKWSKIEMKINTLSNFEYNTTQTLTLSSQLWLLSNPDQRDSAIKEFKQLAAMQLDKTNKITIGRPNSSIYIPMIRELNRLAKSGTQTRIAIFYSDLRENTKLFSIYKKSDQELLKVHSDKVKKMFLELEKPSNLNGIRVYLIFEPRDDLANESFNVMSIFIKKILEEAGAHVIVAANLPTGIN